MMGGQGSEVNIGKVIAMKYQDFRNLKKGNLLLKAPTLGCHYGYQGPTGLNLQLTAEQAVDLAEQLKEQANQLRQHAVEDGAVHLWWKVIAPSRIRCGTHFKTRNPGRNKKKSAAP
jgi:hypothetical protein